MKKKIVVPVGPEPTVVAKNWRGSCEPYLKYPSGVITLYPEGRVPDILKEMIEILDTYGKEYENLNFQSSRDCGCWSDCSCSPTYVLHGTRLETDIEYNFRIDAEKRRQEKNEAQEKEQLNRLMKKYGKE